MSDERREAAIEAAAKAAKDSVYVHEWPTQEAMTATWSVFRDALPRTDSMDKASRAFEAGWFARPAYEAALREEREEQRDHELAAFPALKSLDSAEEVIRRFAKIEDREAGEWLRRHFDVIRAFLNPADPALPPETGEREADYDRSQDDRDSGLCGAGTGAARPAEMGRSAGERSDVSGADDRGAPRQSRRGGPGASSALRSSVDSSSALAAAPLQDGGEREAQTYIVQESWKEHGQSQEWFYGPWAKPVEALQFADARRRHHPEHEITARVLDRPDEAPSSRPTLAVAAAPLQDGGEREEDGIANSLRRIGELANQLYEEGENAGADTDDLKPLVEEIEATVLSVRLSLKANQHPHQDVEREAQDELIERVRAALRPLGYAVGVHGSRERDLDLIAAPWVERCEADPRKIFYALQLAGFQKLGRGNEPGPHGRLGFAIHDIPAAAGVEYIDLSVLLPSRAAEQEVEREAWTVTRIRSVLEAEAIGSNRAESIAKRIAAHLPADPEPQVRAAEQEVERLRKALILLATAREGLLVSDDDEATDAVIDWGYEEKLLASRSIAHDEVEADLTKEGLDFIRAALSSPPDERPALEPENDNERFIQTSLREKGLCGALFHNGYARVACIKSADEPHGHSAPDA
jgi:hypothetical protein